jgi:acetone carboxylase gamma subunit
MMRERLVINDNLTLVRTGERGVYRCTCGRELGPGDANFKKGCEVYESPVVSFGPGYTSSAEEMMKKMCFREFFCPICGVRLATEVARVGDEYLWDVEVRL